MTDVLDRPGTPVVTDSSLDRRVSLRRRLPLVAGALYVVPLMAIAAIARWVNIAGSPQRVDDEGTYVAQAWAVLRHGELAHYTYWYDHPPLGWIQLAGLTAIGGPLAGRVVDGGAVVEARVLMLVPAVVVALLVFVVSSAASVIQELAARRRLAAPSVIAGDLVEGA